MTVQSKNSDSGRCRTASAEKRERGTMNSESTRRIKSNRAAGSLCLQNRTYRAASAGALGVLLATSSSVAVAQTAPATSPQAAPAAPAQADKNADISGTAQRRKQRVIDVPYNS